LFCGFDVLQKGVQFFSFQNISPFYIMSGNGSTFSEYIQGNALPKITPTATNSGPIQTGMQSKSIGGSKSVGGSKKQRRSGRSKKGGASKRRSQKGRKSRSNRR
jgi:hypothetical protein